MLMLSVPQVINSKLAKPRSIENLANSNDHLANCSPWLALPRCRVIALIFHSWETCLWAPILMLAWWRPRYQWWRRFWAGDGPRRGRYARRGQRGRGTFAKAKAIRQRCLSNMSVCVAAPSPKIVSAPSKIVGSYCVQNDILITSSPYTLTGCYMECA